MCTLAHYPIRIDFVPPLKSYRRIGLLFTHFKWLWQRNFCNGKRIEAAWGRSGFLVAEQAGAGGAAESVGFPPTTTPEKNLRWGHVLVPKNTFTDVFDNTCDIGGSERTRVREFTQRQLTTTATATKTSLKKWICAASNFIALIPSRLIRQMLANFLELRILKDCIKVQEKKKKVVVFCSRPRRNVKLGSLTL